MRSAFKTALPITLLAAGSVLSEGRPTFPQAALQAEENGEPVYCYTAHATGKLVLPVGNNGSFGFGRRTDCFTGQPQYRFCEYPRGSSKVHLSSGYLAVGAILDRDTLVATQFRPGTGPHGGSSFSSSIDPTRPWYDPEAAHHEVLAVYSDTCTDCGYRPLNIEVTERSMSWCYDYAQDMVLFDYSVKNIGTQRLRHIYIGVFMDADIFWYTDPPIQADPRARDDMVGFLEYFPADYLGDACPPDSHLVNIAWTADDDANLTLPQVETQVRSAIGLRFIRTPRDSLPVSFNWWSSDWRYVSCTDFGPQARATYRPLSSGGYGSPQTNEEWYHFLRNGERDYDQPWQATRPGWDPLWVQAPAECRDSLISGLDPRCMLSTGPFGLDPGQSLQFTTAVFAGPHFHRHGNIHQFLPYDPVGWFDRVWFDQLARNAIWAEWVYDNPGVDTDSDGYAGEFVICPLGEDSVLLCDTLVDTAADPDTTCTRCYWAYDIADTVWRKGDGIADFKGAYPPPNPSIHRLVNRHGDTVPAMRVYPEVGKIRLVWNGAASENTPDPFSRRYDFEGYGVYIAHDNNPGSFSMVSSYDRENYSRWQYNHESHRFVCDTRPYTLEELRCLHGDSCGDLHFHPDLYSRDNPLIVFTGTKVDDKVYYFAPMGYNRSILANDPINATSEIRKVYPNAVRPPHVHPDSIAIHYPDRNDTTYFTADGYLKYYEYEYTFDNILATMPYWVNVTAFDHGYPELGVRGLETDPAFMPKAVYPLPSSEVIAERDLKVFVYPNPYRLDADYRDRDYEGRQVPNVIPDRTRLIHFANLPPKCTIRVFSLDGDLIRELHHDVDPLDYLANHETWDLINRNWQLVVSGLYFWTVEDDHGNTQIGKLVVIM